MSINYSAILSDLATWASAAKVVGGAFLHKIGSYLYKLYQDGKAEAAKLAAEAEAAAKKL